MTVYKYAVFGYRKPKSKGNPEFGFVVFSANEIRRGDHVTLLSMKTTGENTSWWPCGIKEWEVFEVVHDLRTDSNQLSLPGTLGNPFKNDSSTCLRVHPRN